MQDDSQELAQEIAKQARIYQGGAVTLLAGDCSSVDGGFLHRRSRSTFKLSIRLPDGKTSRILLQRQRYSPDGVDTRAWIFQESR